MRLFPISKSRITQKKKATPLHGGSVKATQLFNDRGKSALYSMLKPSPKQKYFSFD